MATAAPEIPPLARDQAFELLYRYYVKDVYHYALALLRNPADAEDVTQTTFLNAYRAYQRGVEVEKPQNWLIKIAHNVARTGYARASRRVKEVPLDEHIEQLAVAEAEGPDVVAILRALGRLSFNQRAALVMRELEGRPYAEIADTIGVSVSAVETLIFRARKSLRLKSSALRALGAVPLPSSLTQLFEGGGVVAGGGAAVGTGFLVKAAVALLAGAVATGIGGNQKRPNTVAADGADSFLARPEPTRTINGARIAAHDRIRAVSVTAAAATKPAGNAVLDDAPLRAQAGSGTSVPIQGSQLPSQVSSLPSTVGPVTGATSTTLPVQGPSLPPAHVDVPKSLPPLQVDVPNSLPPIHVDAPKIRGGTPLP